MKISDEELYERVLKRDSVAIARLISLLESGEERARTIQIKLFPKTGRAHVIGITGSPGAGKSTLVDRLATNSIKAAKKVAVIAVDPSSPFSGGAVLGDRIRMIGAGENNDIFMRSMATRGALGGISKAVLDAVLVLDAAGFDLVLLETVGVGQGEVDVITVADTCAVVMVPGMGDEVQAIKAGILEIADLFLINKSDRPGADLIGKDLRMLLTLTTYGDDDWKPPILSTIATSGQGIDEVLAQAALHREWLLKTKAGKTRRAKAAAANIQKIATEMVSEELGRKNIDLLAQMAEQCISRKLDPFTAAQSLIQKLK